jgi:hypothetical protein
MRFAKHWIPTIGLLLAVGAPLCAAPLQRPGTVRDAPRARPQPQVPLRPPAAANRVPTRPPIADALEGVLANGLQRRLRLNDAQLDRIRPALRDNLQRRNRLAQDSIGRRNEIREALREGRSEEEIERLIEQLDATNRQLRGAREEFFASIDPELSPRQRAMLRNEWPELEAQIRNLIEQSRRPQP